MKRACEFLVTVEKTEPNPRAGERYWTGKGYKKCPEVLVHQAYLTVRAPAQAQQLRLPFEGKVTVERKKYRKPRGLTNNLNRRASDGECEDIARNYARWLARRDGLELPLLGYHSKVRVNWSVSYSPILKTRRAFWNGVREIPKSQRRIQAVEWGREVDWYATRKDGKQGAYLGKQWECDLRIEIPHWDWWPTEPTYVELENVA